MEIDDLFTWEQLGPVTASPDGRWLAVVIARARTSSEIYRDFPGGPADADHSDIWLVNTATGAVENITNGEVDRSGYWSPTWSPDGRRVAMLSTKGGVNVHPLVWDMTSRRLTQLTDLGFELAAYGDESWPAAALLWIDNTTLICPLRVAGSPPTYHGMSKIRSTAVALDAWANAARGAETTASVLDSPISQSEGPSSTGLVVAIDVVSRHSRTLTTGSVRRLLVDPTRRHIALVATTYLKPPSRKARLQAYMSGSEEWWHTRLTVADVSSPGSGHRFDEAVEFGEPTTGRFAVFGDHPHSWAPDGSLLAVVLKSGQGAEREAQVAVVSATTGGTRPLQGRRLDVQGTAWSTGGQLLVLAKPITNVPAVPDTVRADWWVIDTRAMNGAVNVTAKLKAVPQKMIRTPKTQIMLGLADGDLWSIDVRTGTTVNATESFQPRIATIVWPALSQQRLRPQRTLIVEAEDHVLYRVDWDGVKSRVGALTTPSAGASLAAFDPANGLIVFTEKAPSGSFLWVGDTRGHFAQPIALNRQVAKIADATRMLLEYRGANGDSLKGILLLPTSYIRGERYPLVTFVYPGTVVKDTLSARLDKQSVNFLNLYLLTARGYAVLIPSIPLEAEGQPSDPHSDIPKGVMPAVDRAVDLGIADPQRLAVMGHSYGGYGVLSLLTHTQRFKAGVALAGPADLLSLYGSLFAARRYESQPLDELFFQALAESGQLRMGSPPWVDVDRYLRNSPISLADRIRTPLLLMQGDMDYVPIQQGEQLFAALYRLGREARFIRYWGEGHVITSPANIKDMWQRIFVWLDEHVAPASRVDSLRRPSVGAIAP